MDSTDQRDAISALPAAYEGLAELLSLASHAVKLKISEPDFSTHLANDVGGEDTKFPELRRAFQASRIRHLNLHAWVFKNYTRAMQFLDLFPCLTRVKIDAYDNRDPIPENFPLATHQNSRLTVLCLARIADPEILDKLDLGSLFPNVAHFNLDIWPAHQTFDPAVWNIMPVFRKLLSAFSPRLKSLSIPNLSWHFDGTYGTPILLKSIIFPHQASANGGVEPPLAFPPNLEYLEMGVNISNPDEAYIEFLAVSLLQYPPGLQKLYIVVGAGYDPRPEILDSLSAEKSSSIRQLDEALATKVGYLDWEDSSYFNKRAGLEFDELAARVESSLEAGFPQVWKKFFADLPKPKPGGCVEGANAIRFRSTFLADFDDDILGVWEVESRWDAHVPY